MALPDSDYNDALLNATGQRNWLFLGLVLSLALHCLLCFYLYQTRFAAADLALEATLPRTAAREALDVMAAHNIIK